MTSIVSFPIKPTPMQEAIQQVVEYNPTKCLFILIDEDRGISFVAPPETELSEINWALDICKQTILEMAYED